MINQLKELAINVAACITFVFYSIYYTTIRIDVANERVSPQRLSPGQQFIYVFWHSKTFILVPYSRNSGLAVLTLLDWKNRIYDKLCKRYGYKTFPIARADLSAVGLKDCLDQGSSIALALDGHRGPLGKMKRGALHLSRTTRTPLIAVKITASHSLRLSSRWDRYEIPMPFSKASIVYSQPMQVTDENLEAIEERMEEILKNAF